MQNLSILAKNTAFWYITTFGENHGFRVSVIFYCPC